MRARGIGVSRRGPTIGVLLGMLRKEDAEHPRARSYHDYVARGSLGMVRSDTCHH